MYLEMVTNIMQFMEARSCQGREGIVNAKEASFQSCCTGEKLFQIQHALSLLPVAYGHFKSHRLSSTKTL